MGRAYRWAARLRHVAVVAAVVVAALIASASAGTSASAQTAAAATKLPTAATHAAHKADRPQVPRDINLWTDYFFYPYTPNATDPYANCMYGRKMFDQQQLTKTPWPTDLCRWPVQPDGDGFVALYNVHAGSDQWFMKMGFGTDSYFYYTDSYNDQDRTVWYRYPANNPGALEISVTLTVGVPPLGASTNPYMPLVDYARQYPDDAYRYGENDLTERGILLYLRNVVEQTAADNSAPSAVDATGNAIGANELARHNWENIYGQQQAGDLTSDQYANKAANLAAGASDSQAIDNSVSAVPVCDPSLGCPATSAAQAGAPRPAHVALMDYPRTAADSPGYSTRYVYPIGGTGDHVGCMQVWVEQYGQPVATANTDLCRTDVGNGYYNYYRYVAGVNNSGNWFICMGQDQTYRIWTDALNWNGGYRVWFRFPLNGTGSEELKWGAGRWETVQLFTLLHSPEATIAILSNDKRDLGIMTFMLNAVYSQTASQFSSVNQSSTQQADAASSVQANNNAAYGVLLKINDGQLRASEEQLRLIQQEKLEAQDGLPGDIAEQQAKLDVPVGGSTS